MKHSMLVSIFVIASLAIFTSAKVVRISETDVLDYSPPKQQTPPAMRSFNSFLSSFQNEKQSSTLRKSQYGQRLVPGDDGCEFFPEIVFVQDISSSYQEDMINLRQLMPELFQFFEDRFQGMVRFGVTTFVDKTVHPFGYKEDFCARVDLPLTAVNSEEAVKKAQDVFGKLYVGGGNDYLEGANEAMFRAAASDSVGWSTATHDPVSGRPILRLLVVATDAPVHDPEYYNNLEGLNLPPYDLTDSAHREQLHKSINYRCGATDYPAPDDIRRVFKERGITPIVFSGVSYYMAESKNGPKKVQWKQYKEMLKRYNETKGPWADLETGLASYYEWYMREQLRTDAVVEIIDSTSSNFIEVFRRAMEQVTELTCLPPTTTTPAPLTTTEEVIETLPPTRPPLPTTTTTATTTTTTTTTTTAATSSSSDGGVVPPPSDLPTQSTSSTNGQVTSSSTDSPIQSSSSEAPVIPTDAPSSSSSSSSSSSTDGTNVTPPSSSSSTDGTNVTPPATSEGGHGSTTSTTTTTTTTTTTEGSSGGGAGIIIGSAAGGAAVGAAALGVLAAKKLGLAGFGGSSGVDTSLIQDVDNVEITQDREQFEAVTGDLFS